MKVELAHKQFDFMTAGLSEGFVWDLNERCHSCACLCGVRMTPQRDQRCNEDPY